MRLMKRVSVGVLCVFCTALINGCGDSGTEQKADQTDLAEAERKLEEAQRLLEQAKTELEQAKTGQAAEPEVPAYVPPPDHLEPFDISFGFGNHDEVAHFWNWTQNWEFTDEQATNKEKPGGAVLESTYKLAGDFQITLKGKLSQSWTNSKRSTFEVCGQSIGLAKWRPVGLDLSVEREGNQLTYTLAGQAPVVVELSEEQTGSTQAKLLVYGRHVFIKQFNLAAESASRIVSSDSTP